MPTKIPSNDAGPVEPLEVARYVTEMLGLLEALAMRAQIGLLAYFLGMAKAEGELFIRSGAQAEGPRAEYGDVGPEIRAADPSD